MASTRPKSRPSTVQYDPEELFTKHERIGRGSFGEVFKGIDNRTKQIIAIKIIDLEEAEDEIEDIQQEITVLSQCDSPYVTRYYGSYLKGTKLWIIMEYLGGGSAQRLRKRGPFTENQIATILREIIRGLLYLHRQRKLHRDIKAANVLLSEQGAVKLADFGVAGQLTETLNKCHTFVGTPFWMAPEVIKQSAYDTKADIWSLGITALELANGDPPLSDLHPMKALLHIPQRDPPKLLGNYSKALKNFVATCCVKDPVERPSAAELLNHKFIKSYSKKTSILVDLISRYNRWIRSGQVDSDDDDDDINRGPTDYNIYDDDDEGWLFETVRQRGMVSPLKNPALVNGFPEVKNTPKFTTSQREPNFHLKTDDSPIDLPDTAMSQSPAVKTSKCMQTIIKPVLQQIKENAAYENMDDLDAIDELMKGFEFAEVSSPGVTDQMVHYMKLHISRSSAKLRMGNDVTSLSSLTAL